MMDNGISVFSEWLPGRGFMLRAGDNSYKTVFHELKYLLFARHQATYYGTFIDTGNDRGKEVLYLSPLTSLDFFTKRTWSNEVDWQWSDEILLLLETAPRFKKALAGGYWKPDFDKWREGKRGWRMDWERGVAFSDLPAKVPFIDEWADLIINELIKQKPEIGQAWEQILSSYPVLVPVQNWDKPTGGDEETWLEAAGWQQDHTPFRTCLELAEPEGENPAWLLNVILQDKKDRGSLFAWGHGLMPLDWQMYAARVERNINKWIKILPWLEDSSGAGTVGMRREINEAEAWDFLNTGSIQLAQAGHTVFLPKWWQEVQKLVPALKIRTRTSVGSSKESRLGVSQLVQFDWNLAVGNLELPEEEFRRLVAKKRRLVQIQGKWIQLSPAYVKKIQQYLRKKDGISLGEILHMRLSPQVGGPSLEQDAGQAEALHVEVELSGQLAQLLEQLHNQDRIPMIDTVAAFCGTLRKYQMAGASWLLFLRRFGLGGCLADDMGLGKTIQWIAYLLIVKENEKPPNPSLLICPTSVLGNWQKEIARFAPSLKAHLHYGPQRAKSAAFLSSIEGSDLVLTSYNLANIDEEELSAVEWDCVCLDEAQNIKNAYTKQAAAVRKLKGRHRIAMTGTPMENRLTELWSLFDFINPGYLGSSKEFSRSFIKAIENKGDAANIERVHKLIRPFLLRRVKNDPSIELDLPEKQEQKEYIPLTVEQASLYESVLEELFNKLENSEGMARRGLVLSTLSKLKQICDHPALFLKEGPPESISAASKKVERLLEMIAELRRQGDRCLIFTQFIRMGQMLQEVLLKELGEESYYLHGSTPRKERDEMVASFQDTAANNCNIFILSLKAGGLGLNLTAANHVFHFDRWWNPAVEDQATDRSHRIGQNRHVMVHKFISLGTMEERIDEILERKAGLNERIIGKSEAWVTEIPTHELRELFSLRKEWVGA